MPVRINVETNVTLANLVEQRRRGFMVEETPHIGNLASSSLALLSLGLQAKLVDVTIGEKDNLFYPHCQIINGQSVVIAPSDLMSTHNKVSSGDESVIDFHYQPLAQMGFDATPHSLWVRDRKAVVQKILAAVVVGDYLSLWQRYVTANGIVRNDRYDRSQLLSRVHKVTVPNNGEGWVIPNVINILFDLVIGPLETGRDSVYMLSGQSMYKYITAPFYGFGTMDRLLSNLYDLVRSTTLPELPETLNVVMVPVPVVRNFVSPMTQKGSLDRKLRYFEKQTASRRRCGIKLSQRKISPDELKRFVIKRKSIFGEISSCLSLVCANSETGRFYSQHDLAVNNDTMYIPDYVMDMTIARMVDRSNKMVSLAA